VYGLAEKLGKFVHEVMAMPHHELTGWIAYLKHQASTAKHHG
jgi:hypothetical protein